VFNSISLSQIYVLDHAQAIDFYVGKLELEIASDTDLGFMRWLTVRVPGDLGREILLEIPGAPAMDPTTAGQLRQLVTKGAGGWIGLTTPDCRMTYERLLGRGVEFTQEPTERPYGIDCGARDPFGNGVRIIQPS
jgi:predicted enzyme related to lactoylglutathione lyase